MVARPSALDGAELCVAGQDGSNLAVTANLTAPTVVVKGRRPADPRAAAPEHVLHCDRLELQRLCMPKFSNSTRPLSSRHKETDAIFMKVRHPTHT
jgi:hypothetical protein